MLNIFSFSDISYGYSTFFLDILTLIGIFSGIFIIITKNPIVSVLYLILLFSSVACYLILTGIQFIGISYLLVYVGAVSILFLFILMLINIRISELTSDTNNNIPLAIIATIAFFIPYNNIIPENKNNDFIENNKVFYVSSSDWDGKLVDISDIISIGNIMYTSYFLWLLITSIILLLAMVGAIVITIKQKN